jgi:hypothetical protein
MPRSSSPYVPNSYAEKTIRSSFASRRVFEVEPEVPRLFWAAVVNESAFEQNPKDREYSLLRCQEAELPAYGV